MNFNFHRSTINKGNQWYQEIRFKEKVCENNVDECREVKQQDGCSWSPVTDLPDGRSFIVFRMTKAWLTLSYLKNGFGCCAD